MQSKLFRSADLQESRPVPLASKVCHPPEYPVWPESRHHDSKVHNLVVNNYFQEYYYTHKTKNPDAEKHQGSKSLSIWN